MIRVLHVMGCSDAGGISSVVLNFYRFIDREKIHFDIALTIPTVGQNGKALQALGAGIHFLPLKSEGLARFRKELEKLLVEGKYDAIHVHESETCYVALQVAQKLGIPCRIAHSHTSSPYEGIKSELRRLSGILLNYPAASHVIGCGKLSGDRVFGKWNMKRPKAMVLPNAVDTGRFAFDAQVRSDVRKELGVEGSFVLGMVGRLSEEKNYPFALELTASLVKEFPDCVLVIAGNGDEEEKLKNMVRDLGIESHVKMLGRRADVERLYQAYDVFLLPSFHEGFPVSAVEAMAAGLPVVLSSTITRELAFGMDVKYLSIRDLNSWKDHIADLISHCPEERRLVRQEMPREYGFDIRSCAEKLADIYLNAKV